MRLSEIPETVEEIFEWIQKEDPTIVEKETEKLIREGARIMGCEEEIEKILKKGD